MKTNATDERVNLANLREVTNPIKADDLHTPRVLQLAKGCFIVVGCTPEQGQELKNEGGEIIEDGVIFEASKSVISRLRSWQNQEAKKERAQILGDEWELVEWNTSARAKVGDEVVTVDGRHFIVTEATGTCIIRMKDIEGKEGYSVGGGYFVRKSFDTEHYKKILTAEWWGNAPRTFSFGGWEVICVDKGGVWNMTAVKTNPLKRGATLEEVAEALAGLNSFSKLDIELPY